jgi:hypothetical protein
MFGKSETTASETNVLQSCMLQITSNNLKVKVKVCTITTYNFTSFARSTTGQMPALVFLLVARAGV